jgi:hypothetical protein
MNLNSFQNRKGSTNWLGTFSLFCFIFAIAMLLMTAHPATAQTAQGTIVGTLTDASGGVVPHTPITLVNTDTQAKYGSVTDGAGYYQFQNVPPGNYKVTVTKTGFKTLARGPFALQVEGSLRINLALEVGNETQTVTVTASSPLIQAETTSLGTVVDERQATEIPLNGRNPMNLTALVPSVVPQGQSTGNTNSANPFAWGNYQIGGGMANQSATFIDGAPVNTTYINLTALVPTQDSLAEFKVDTNNLTADYGHLAGGAIQFSTKSGTNKLHGAMWEYFRNKVLNANDYWSNNSGTPRGSFSQNQFGFNVGGPVFLPHVYDGHNKTFFFFDYEGFYLRQGQSFSNVVPTSAQVAGDLSTLTKVPVPHTSPTQYVIPQLYDPNTTCTNPNGCTTGNNTNTMGNIVNYGGPAAFGARLPIPNNDLTNMPSAGMHAPAHINPVAQAYLNTFYPVSKVSNSAWSNAPGYINYVANAPLGGQNFEYVAHIDHNVSEKQHISSRYTYWKNANLPQDPLGTGMCQDRCAETFATQNWVFDDTYAFNATTILDMRLSYQRFSYGRVAKDTAYSPSTIGQTLGNNTSPEFPGPLMISINGYDVANTFGSGGGDSTIGNASDNDRIAGTLTKIIGKHTFKFGGEYLRATFNYFQSNNSEGQGSATNDFTLNNHVSGNGDSVSGAGLASFLLGYPDSIGYNTVSPNTSEMLYPAVFVTDDWRATPKLTLHIGARWENGLPWTDRQNDISYFDQTQINPILAANASLLANNTGSGAAPFTATAGSAEVVDSATRSSRHPYNTFNKQFSPRVGLTYAVRPNTVVSLGYGLLWIPLDVGFDASPNNDPINAFSTQTVSSIDGSLTPDQNFANPLPGGIIAPPKRSAPPNGSYQAPNGGFQYTLLGTGFAESLVNNPYPYAQQWNFGVQQQFGSSMVLDVAYAGAKGTHLPFYSLSISALPDSYLTTDQTALNTLGSNIPNPFYNIINPSNGLGASTVGYAHMHSPYPWYNGVSSASADQAGSTYNSLQVKLQKRFTGGASIGAGYTYAKLISATDTLTGWLESSSADNWGVVDPNNLKLEKSLSSNDVRNRLVVSYIYDIPVGRGKAFLPNISRLADSVIGGWGIEGITTLQSGYPVPMGEQTNSNGTFGFGQRPNFLPGCDRKARPAGATVTSEYFNISCFQLATVATFGNDGRNDSVVKEPGIDNWDTSIYKNVSIDKDGRASVQFRAEFFNVFNRVQFGAVNAGIGGGNAGTITSQNNNPRLVQFALRIKY